MPPDERQGAELDVALGVSENVRVELLTEPVDLGTDVTGQVLALGAEVPAEALTFDTQVTGERVHTVDEEEDRSQLAGDDREHDGDRRLEECHHSRIVHSPRAVERHQCNYGGGT